MTEYKNLLQEYSSEKYFLYAKSSSYESWMNFELAEQYLEKYWLSEEEYLTQWKPVQDKIFINQSKGLPEILYPAAFEMLVLRGGFLFSQEDFHQLQSCVKALNDSHLLIIQNDFGQTKTVPPFRMKYPLDISWDELMNGSFISTVIFEMFANEYFVFSESANWGKYSANDYEHPLDILGFKANCSSTFKDHFTQSLHEKREIMTWLPQSYKGIIQ